MDVATVLATAGSAFAVLVSAWVTVRTTRATRQGERERLALESRKLDQDEGDRLARQLALAWKRISELNDELDEETDARKALGVELEQERTARKALAEKMAECMRRLRTHGIDLEPG